MTRLIKTALLLVCLGWQAMAIAADSGWLTSAQNDHARVRLQGDFSNPAQSRLLLEVELESGWKSYWRSPGQGGIAPQILWQHEAPTQVQWHWPTPKRFEVAGLSTQGYQGDVRFPMTLNASKGSTLSGILRLSTCSNVCILTDFPFQLVLADAAPGGFDFAYAQAMSTLPQAMASDIKLTAGYGANELQLVAERPQGWQQPAIFLDGQAEAEFGEPKLQVEGQRLVARIPVSDGWQGDAPDLTGRLQGLLLVDGEQAWQGETSINAPLALPAAGPDSGHSLLWLIGTALLGGLILNLMPCVLPVLALKLGSILQLETRARRPIRLQFLAASAGILVSFWALALMSTLLRATQGAVGWGIQFQSVWFIGFMVMVTLLFCANLLGLFEFRLPSRLSTRLATTGDNSLGGHFLQGSFATLLATPCSAPFLGTAVAFALGAPLGQLWLIFTALGIGMSLPWLAIAAWPSLALWLPKPGPWMGRLRMLLGLMMLGSSLWLLSLLSAHLGSLTTGWLMAAVLLALLVAIGWRHGVRGFTLTLALSALIGGALLLGGALTAPNTPQRETVQWLPLSESALQQALTDNKRVFIDVTADWCVTCKANKYNVLLRDEVQSALSAPDVVALRGDWTRPNDSLAAFLRARGAVAVPFNQIYGPGLPKGEVLSPLLDKADLLTTLHKAGLLKAGTTRF